MEITESFQSQKTIDQSMDVDNSSTTTTTATSEIVSAQTSIEIKKVSNSSNGQTIATESIDNHQDDDLIRELEQFEGSKKDDDVTPSLPKSSTEANGSNLQDTSDLLKDLESDSPCPGQASESDIDIAPIDSIISDELMGIDQIKKSDDIQVDSTTESTNKRKCSLDNSVESAPKRANSPDVLNTDTQKSLGEIDSDTESKLLQENSDGEASISDVGEASISDVVEAITSTSTVTKTATPNDVTSDVKLVDKIIPSNKDLVVSSSVETAAGNVGSTKDVKKVNVSKDDAVDTGKSTESKGDDEVSSNKMNDTTEVMEQDFNETLEADRISENDKKATSQSTSSLSATNKSTPKKPNELLVKTSDTVASSQPDNVVSTPSTVEAGNLLAFLPFNSIQHSDNFHNFFSR